MEGSPWFLQNRSLSWPQQISSPLEAKLPPQKLCHLLPGALGPCELPLPLAALPPAAASGLKEPRERNPASAEKYLRQSCISLTSPLLVWCSEDAPAARRDRELWQCQHCWHDGEPGSEGLEHHIKYFCRFFSSYANISVEVESGQV